MKISNSLVQTVRPVAIGVGILAAAVAGPLIALAFSYVIVIDTATFSGTTLNITGHASIDHYPGQASDQSVDFDWGDGTPIETVVASSLASYSDDGHSINIPNWTKSHTYASAGSHTVTVKIYHANPQGNEGSSLGTFTIQTENTLALCTDGIDNDKDGLIDGADPDCLGTLQIVKVVSGSTASPSAFSFQVNAGSATAFNATGTNNVTEPAGTYSVTEVAAPGYATTYNNCSGVVVNPAATTVCTITNTFIVVPPPAADLSVTKTVDHQTPGIGSTVIYTVTATNNGPDAATGVKVTDQLPSGVTYVSDDGAAGAYISGTGVWTIGSLASGASETLHISATVDADTGAHTITNTATVTGDQTDSTLSNNTSGPVPLTVACPDGTHAVGGECIANPPTSFTITSTEGTGGTIDPLGNTTVAAAGSQNYTITPSSLFHILDVLVDGATDLGPVSTYNFTNVTMDHTIAATFAADSADLSVSKVLTSENPTPAPGDTVTYTVTVTNGGPDTATNVLVTDALQPGLTLLGTATASVGSYDNATGKWTISSLAANGTPATLTISAKVADTGYAGREIINTAIVSSDSSDSDTDNNTSEVDVTVTCPPDTTTLNTDTHTCDANPTTGTLTIVKNTTGGDGTFTFNVTGDNASPESITTVEGTGHTDPITLTAGDITVTENANDGFTPGAVSCMNGDTTIGSTDVDGHGDAFTLAAGDNVTCTFNNAAIPPAPTDSDVGITKTVDTASPAMGDTVTYTITASNSGPADAIGVMATDTLPSGLTFASATPSVGTYDSGTGVWTIGNLANSSSATLLIAATVNSGTAADVIENIATVSSTSNDPHPDNNTTGPVDITVTCPSGQHASDGACVANPSGGAGGGGGGGTSSHGGSGQVLGASAAPGQVLGESCGVYMDKHLRLGSKKNDADQASKLQTFLNKWMSANLPVTGFYGPLTTAAVKAFQAKYSDDILKPWNITSPTGIVYYTTLYEVNKIECPALTQQLPPLVDWSKNPNAQ